jgi:predicted nucleotide-binding protein
VAVLLEEGVERPSDMDGLVYIPLDPGNEWQRLLVRELQAVGLEHSLDRLL